RFAAANPVSVGHVRHAKKERAAAGKGGPQTGHSPARLNWGTSEVLVESRFLWVEEAVQLTQSKRSKYLLFSRAIASSYWFQSAQAFIRPKLMEITDSLQFPALKSGPATSIWRQEADMARKPDWLL